MDDKDFHGYKNYDDWYDNGPGSESFKREIRKSSNDFWKNKRIVIGSDFVGFVDVKKEK
jgi:hypothetical protein